MTRKVNATILTILAVLISCNDSSQETADPVQQSPQSTPAPPSPPPPPPPDGIVCFASHDGWDFDDHPQITIVNTDGSGYRVLTCLSPAQLDLISDVAWCPDASSIAFIGDRGSVTSIFIVSADNTGYTKITQDENNKLDICWSPTGEYIAYKDVISTGFLESDCRICVIRADGSDAHYVTEVDENASDPRWSEDGQIVFYSSGSQIGSVYLDGSSTGLSENQEIAEYYGSAGVVTDLDYSAIQDSMASGGEISVNTPYWTYPLTYLNRALYINGPVVRNPKGDLLAATCRIGSDEFFCLIDPISLSVTIPEPPSPDNSWNEISLGYLWINDTDLLFFGKRQNKIGFCVLDASNGQLQWILNHERDERVFDRGSWDYVPWN